MAERIIYLEAKVKTIVSHQETLFSMKDIYETIENTDPT